jgi:hypothetical protein
MAPMGKQHLIIRGFQLARDSILRADRHDFDFTAFQAVTEYISFTVNARCVGELCLNLIKLLDRFLVRKWKSESEVCGL